MGVKVYYKYNCNYKILISTIISFKSLLANVSLFHSIKLNKSLASLKLWLITLELINKGWAKGLIKPVLWSFSETIIHKFLLKYKVSLAIKYNKISISFNKLSLLFHLFIDVKVEKIFLNVIQVIKFLPLISKKVCTSIENK